MEIEKVRRLLASVALDHSASKPDEAIQTLALVLMHMAEALNNLEQHLAALRLYESRPKEPS